MIKALWFFGLVYLIAVALISVAAAVVTFEFHPKRACSDFRPDVLCRRMW